MCKISKFKLLVVFCFASAIISLGVYVLMSTQSPDTDVIHPIYDSAHDSGSDYAVTVSEPIQDVLMPVPYEDIEIVLPANAFDCDCIIAMPEEAQNNDLGYEENPMLRHYIYEIVSPIYDTVRGFSNGYAVVGMGSVWNDEMRHWERGLYGLIDREGNLVLPIIYDNIGDILDTVIVDNCVFVIVTYSGKGGIMNVHGDVILPLIYTRVSIQDNFAVVSYGIGDDRTAGLFNLLTREFVIPKGIYVAISDFISEYRAWVTLGPANGWRWGVVDLNNGELLTPMV